MPVEAGAALSDGAVFCCTAVRLFLALRVVLRQYSISVAFGAKRTLNRI
jgi:hypothetical protein